MTIFRSKWADFGAQSLAAVGILGFLTCGSINMIAQQRLLGHQEFQTPSPERPIKIKLKEQNLFVERKYADRFLLANRLLFPFWMVGALGVVWGNRAKIAEWWKSRRS